MSARTTCLVLGSICGLAFPWSQAPGQVATDGTVGPRLALAGPDFAIGAELGRRAGGNLFHSFERFSIQTGRSATFSGPDDVENVISRVTGGTRSDIDGVLRSTIPGADFFFLNPAGVLFGPNASLDVQGSFHVSTADELRFADGATFSATNPDASSLTVAAPEAFGFLGADPAAITVDRSTLEVDEGQAFSIVGGDITILGDPDAEQVNVPWTVRAEAGQITLAAAAGPARLDVATGELEADQRAGITLGDQARVDVSGDGGGAVRIDSSSFVLEGQSFVFAVNTGPLDAEGGISVDADGITITGGAALTTHATGTGDAGRLTIQADALEVRSGGLISSTTFATGDAGELTITAGDLKIRDGGEIISATVSAGDAGDASTVTVTVTAGDLEIRDGFIRSVSIGAGDAGRVAVAADRLTLLEGGQISSSPFGESTGAGGEVQVTARVSLLIAGRDARDDPSGIFASALGAPNSEGAAGNVIVTAEDGLKIRDGGQITSATESAGDAGAVTVTVTAGDLEIRDGFIRSVSGGAGDAGSVTVAADRLTLLEGGQISSSPLGESTGAGGEVQVTARESLLIAGRDARDEASGIFASAEGAPNSEGAAGNVIVTAEDGLEIRDGAQITSATESAGNAGAVTVRVTAGDLEIRDGGKIDSSTSAGGDAGTVTVTVTAGDLEVRNGFIQSVSGGAGDGGSVTVAADRLTLLEGGQISSSALGESTGAGGQVQVTARESLLIAGHNARDDPSGIFAGTEDAPNSEGAAGNVIVTAEDGLEIRDGAQIRSAAVGGGAAGKVTVEADRLVLDRAAIITASASAGGGEIQLLVGDVIDLHDSIIITSVFGGNDPTAGNVRIDPTVLIIDGSIIEADASAGSGGNVRITADNVLVPEGDLEGLLARGDISASGATEEVNGTVAISAPEVDLTGGLVVLELPLLDAASLLRERCAARRDIGASSFTGVGKGGLPPSPDQPLLSDYLLGASPASGAAAAGKREAEVGLFGAPTVEGTLALAPVVLLQPCTGAL